MVDRKARKQLLAIAGMGLGLTGQIPADSVATQRSMKLAAKGAPTAIVGDAGTVTINAVTGANGMYMVTHNIWVLLAGSSGSGTFAGVVTCSNGGGIATGTNNNGNLNSAAGVISQNTFIIACANSTLQYKVVMSSPAGSTTLAYEYEVWQLQ